MPATLSLTEAQVCTALRNVLLGILPVDVEVVRGQANRVPEPVGPDFVVFWPLLRGRLSTNIDTYTDNLVTGSIAGTVLTVAAVIRGSLAAGNPVYGANVAAGTYIAALGSGTGGVGTYTVAPAQTVASAMLACGTGAIEQPTEFTIQLDVHGPASADNAQLLSTLLRDQYAVEAFEAEFGDIAPLYTSDPRQLAFEDGEQQTEDRWIVEVHLQANPVVTVGQQFADQIQITTISAEMFKPVSALVFIYDQDGNFVFAETGSAIVA